MADLQEAVGIVIRRERRMRRLTLREVAARAATSLVYLSEIERGKKYPSALVLERLALALGLSVSELLERIAGDLRAAEAPEREPVHAVGIVLPRRSPVAARATTEGEIELRAA
jgi:transcriptional regulator with XRE-family HTH domain